MANEGLWEQLEALEGQEMARRAGCQYEDEPGRYTIRVLQREYLVDLSARRVLSALDRSEAGYARELCILAYLINSKDLPVRGKLIPAASLPGGQFFFRGPHKLPTEKLEDAFGDNPDRLYKVADEFGARRRDFGDAAIQLYVLPRVPLNVVIWRADEEFAARASILFDETAAEQLPLDALWMAANLTVKALVQAADAAR
jgi:hypothetical protein